MIMKRLFTSIITLLATLPMLSQGWPEKYEGVMLQAFYWDGYDDAQWTVLESQADELSSYFKLVWIPQSGNCGGKSMGYDDLYWFPGHYNSSFGTEEELRSMIKTFKDKGIGTIADVVVNHRKNVSNWVDFPAEAYNGVTYQLKSTDICANDDKGATKTWASQNGFSLSENNDTGEGWDGMRDLDHKSENVQKNVKAYLKMLLEDLGYVGFRYDMVKGYSGSYTKLYNEYSIPQFSVGECWDGTSTIRNWIDATGKTSAAFDFQFRYTVRNAISANNWSRLAQQNEGNWPLVSNSYNSGNYKQWAVTFVENHDTERRPNAAQDPIKKDTLAANAYLLAMPGTPCIFMTHWLDCKQDIKSMIDVRRLTEIQNTSTYEELVKNQSTYYAVSTTGAKSKLLAVVGSKPESYTPDDEWVKVLAGYHYIYYVNKSANTAWISLASGTYEGEQKVLLSAVTNNNAKLVYTTDGTTPTASSKQVESGTAITIPIGTTTLSVGLLIGASVSGIQSRTYIVTEPGSFTIPDFCKVNEGETCAFYESPSTWNTATCWAWNTVNYTGGKWPGVACEQVGTLNNGNKVWKWTWDGKCYKENSTTETSPVGLPTGIIFSNNGSSQTADYSFTNGAYYDKKGYVATVTTTGIETIKADMDHDIPNKIFSLDGREVKNPGRGIYIVNKKKVVIK